MSSKKNSDEHTVMHKLRDRGIYYYVYSPSQALVAASELCVLQGSVDELLYLYCYVFLKVFFKLFF